MNRPSERTMRSMMRIHRAGTALCFFGGLAFGMIAHLWMWPWNFLVSAGGLVLVAVRFYALYVVDKERKRLREMYNMW